MNPLNVGWVKNNFRQGDGGWVIKRWGNSDLDIAAKACLHDKAQICLSFSVPVCVDFLETSGCTNLKLSTTYHHNGPRHNSR